MERFDSNRYLFNCNNVTFDLRTGIPKEYSTEDFIAKICPVDYDPKSTEKIALCMCRDEKTVSDNHAMWLEEVVPYYFRLKVHNHTPKADGKYKIRCPFCNNHLRPVTKRASNTRLKLCICSSCADTKKGGRHHA